MCAASTQQADLANRPAPDQPQKWPSKPTWESIRSELTVRKSTADHEQPTSTGRDAPPGQDARSGALLAACDAVSVNGGTLRCATR